MEPTYKLGLKYENKIINMKSETFPGKYNKIYG